MFVSINWTRFVATSVPIQIFAFRVKIVHYFNHPFENAFIEFRSKRMQSAENGLTIAKIERLLQEVFFDEIFIFMSVCLFKHYDQSQISFSVSLTHLHAHAHKFLVSLTHNMSLLRHATLLRIFSLSLHIVTQFSLLFSLTLSLVLSQFSPSHVVSFFVSLNS